MFDHNEYMKEYNKKWCKENPEKRRAITKRYRETHRKERLEYQKQYRRNNPKLRSQWQSHKLKIDIKYGINRRMAIAMWHSLKGNKSGRHWEDLVGYTLKDLFRRLKKTMPEGYIWDDFLKGELHIDHIIPISAFNFIKAEHTDFKKCWGLSNLRLLPAKENRIKYNKLDKPFQPALAI